MLRERFEFLRIECLKIPKALDALAILSPTSFIMLRLLSDAVAPGTRDGMERAAKELERLVKCWGLTQSLAKTKLVVVGGEGVEAFGIGKRGY